MTIISVKNIALPQYEILYLSLDITPVRIQNNGRNIKHSTLI